MLAFPTYVHSTHSPECWKSKQNFHALQSRDLQPTCVRTLLSTALSLQHILSASLTPDTYPSPTPPKTWIPCFWSVQSFVLTLSIYLSPRKPVLIHTTTMPFLSPKQILPGYSLVTALFLCFSYGKPSLQFYLFSIYSPLFFSSHSSFVFEVG